MSAPGLSRELFKFSQWTTCHGIPHMGTSQKIGMTIMWGVLVVVSSVFCVYYVEKLVSKYTARPINVQSEVRLNS